MEFSPGASPDVSASVDPFEDCYQRFEELLSNPSVSTEEVIHRLHQIEEDIHRIEEDQPEDSRGDSTHPVHDLLARIEIVERELSHLRSWHPEVSSELLEIVDQIDQEVHQIWISAVDHGTSVRLQKPEISVIEWITVHLRLGELLTRLRGSDGKLLGNGTSRFGDAIRKLEARLQEVEFRFERDLENPFSSQARVSATRWFSLQADRAAEHLVLADEKDLPQAIALLDATQVELERLVAIGRRLLDRPVEGGRWLSRAEKAPLRSAWRRLKRCERQVRGEAMEKRLQFQLESRWGRQRVGWMENTILGLIILVVVLLVFEATQDLSASTLNVLMWVDTAICAVFLFEFSFKTWLARPRSLYFRRHLFFDLLPSIPFGLFASGIATLDSARGARVVRFLRLPRLIRYLRIARPLVRVFRVIAFAIRGMDRLVRRIRPLLNRPIVFFTSSVSTGQSRDVRRDLLSLRGRCHRRRRLVLASLSPDLRADHLRVELQHLHESVKRRAQEIQGDPERLMHISEGGRPIAAEDVIWGLIQLEPTVLEERVGKEGIRRFHRLLQIFDVPGVRSLPGVGPVVRGVGHEDASVAVARGGRLVGRILRKIIGTVEWVADLHGTLTGSQVIDRLGTALIKSTGRPAKRLLLLGSLFLLLSFFVHVLSIRMLWPLVDTLTRFLGGPLLVLGIICLLLLSLGVWMRRIAGEATDRYDRIAEAQFLNLMEDAKKSTARTDLDWIHRRVFHLEDVVHGRRLAGDVDGNAVDELIEVLSLEDGRSNQFGAGAEGDQEAAKWLLREKLLDLYRDYLDGAPFHANDTKTSSQLLGNVTLDSIRRERLGQGRRELKRLERLDLMRERHLLGGPYLWFHFLTQALSEGVARLLIEYNRNLIPLTEYSIRSESRGEGSRQWIKQRLAWARSVGEMGPEEVEPPPSRGGDLGSGELMTTDFSALDFLWPNPGRESAIERRFGPEVLEILRADRRHLIREVFGTYPLQRWDSERRTINLMSLYERWIGGGRFFWLPFALLWKGVLLSGQGLKKVKQIVHQLLYPESGAAQVRGWATYEVACRILRRMRGPVYLECLHLRSEFDVEYLGLYLPGCRGEGGGVAVAEDLEFIQAVPSVRESIEKLRGVRREQLARFGKLLEDREEPAFSSREGLRAIVCAYLIDYQEVETLLSGMERIESSWRKAIRQRSRSQNGRKENVRTPWLARYGKSKSWDEFCAVWEKSSLSSLGDREKGFCYRATVEDVEGLRNRVKVWAKVSDPVEASRRGWKILEEQEQCSRIWSEQLVSLRMVQSLSVLDLMGYQRVVEVLGGFGDGDRREAVEQGD
ncbi:MAG: ion transporter [Planctomycetota bacterium]|jgi:hypothetical protein|nr:ion transporter [Planctomycetota bacterium]